MPDITANARAACESQEVQMDAIADLLFADSLTDPDDETTHDYQSMLDAGLSS